MATIAYLDIPNKRIHLAEGTREYHPVNDIYREIRQLRHDYYDLRGFDIPVIGYGNVPKGGGKFTPRYAMFRFGWRIVPEDISHILLVTGEQITDEGQAGSACIDFSPLSANSKVIVQYEPPAAEIITVSAEEAVWLHQEKDTLMKQTQSIIEAIGTPSSTLFWHLLAIQEKTDNLPSDPIGYTGLAKRHGSGRYDKRGGGGGISSPSWIDKEKEKLINDIEEILKLLRALVIPKDKEPKLDEIILELKELGKVLLLSVPDEILDHIKEMGDEYKRRSIK